MTNRIFSTSFEHPLGVLGLFLMLVVARLAHQGLSSRRTVSGRLSGLLARRAIDAVALVGWLADRLPPPRP